MEAFSFDRKPVTRIEWGAPTGRGSSVCAAWRSSASTMTRAGFSSTKFGKGSDCPKELRALYEACNRAMLAGDIAGFWLPKELAGSETPWVIEAVDLPLVHGQRVAPMTKARCSTAEVRDLVGEYLKVPAIVDLTDKGRVKAPSRNGGRVKREPKVTISREIEVERPAPVTAVDAFYPPPAPTVTVSESVTFPDALSAYLGRLVYQPKRDYAEKVARALLLGSELPDRPDKDWADDVDVKVRRHLGKVLVSA